jgi:hypothetical protein
LYICILLLKSLISGGNPKEQFYSKFIFLSKAIYEGSGCGQYYNWRE